MFLDDEQSLFECCCLDWIGPSDPTARYPLLGHGLLHAGYSEWYCTTQIVQVDPHDHVGLHIGLVEVDVEDGRGR